MKDNQKQIVKILIEKGKELLNQPYKKIEFTGNLEADDLLNDLKNFPHAFVLACIMDRQIKAEKAWLIPYQVSKEIGGFEFSRLLKLNQSTIKEIFKRKNFIDFIMIWLRTSILEFKKYIKIATTMHQIFGKNAQKAQPLLGDF